MGEGKDASEAGGEEEKILSKEGTSGLRGVFFLPLSRLEDIVVWCWGLLFSVKEGVKPEKVGFWPMRKGLGEKFGVVFSFAVVVTDTELNAVHKELCRGSVQMDGGGARDKVEELGDLAVKQGRPNRVHSGEK